MFDPIRSLSLSFLIALALAAPLTAGEPAGMDWPTWRGPHGNGSAGMASVPLVDRLSKATLVWQSEYMPSTGVFSGDSGGIQSGYSSPIVADGRVYLFYYHGDGKSVDPEVLTRYKNERRMSQLKDRRPANWIEQLASINADEVIHCLDAATGKTLWKTVYEGRGLNIAGLSGKCGGHYTLCYGDGRIYAVGTTKRIYAVDAKTGKKLWEGTFADHKRMENMRAEAEKAGAVSDAGKREAGYPNMAPAYAAGVVVFGDRGNLFGFDAATGKALWGPIFVGRSNSDSSSPLRWSHQGKDYILGAGSQGLFLIEPRSGTVLWKAEDACQTGGTIAISGDRVVVRANSGKTLEDRRGLSCWQISPKDAKMLWQLPPQYSTFQCTSACIHDGRVYVQCELNNGYPSRLYNSVIGEGLVYVAVDLESGKVLGETPGRGEKRIGKNLSASIVAVGDMILDVNAQRHFRADPALLAEGLFETWSREGHERIPTPAIVGTRIFIRDLEGIRCYDLSRR
jgi:outer membrane protein assembly factor BamB